MTVDQSGETKDTEMTDPFRFLYDRKELVC